MRSTAGKINIMSDTDPTMVIRDRNEPVEEDHKDVVECLDQIAGHIHRLAMEYDNFTALNGAISAAATFVYWIDKTNNNRKGTEILIAMLRGSANSLEKSIQN